MDLTNSSLAGVITAFSASVGALTTLVGAFALLIPILRGVRETHKIVNQRMTNMVNYQRALIRTIKDMGGEVPIDQSAEPPTSHQ